MAYLTLNGTKYSYKEIKAGEDFKGLDAYEKTTLLFCKQWLTGQPVFSVHTSGSTGTPKLVTVTRKQMAASAHMTARALGLNKGDHAFVCMNTGYIGGKMMLVRGLEIGMQMIIVTPALNPLQNIPLQCPLDFTALVPMQLQTILEQAQDKLDLLNRMKAVLIGGAVVSPALQQEVQRLCCPVYATYGMTETVSHIALRKLNKGASNIYTAVDDVKIGQDQRGCLTIQSVLTDHKILVTNDLVNITGAREFQWLGRIDNVINSGGIKFQVEQIETKIAAVFEQLSCERRFFVTGIKDEELGEKIVLIMEGAPLPEPEEEKIKSVLVSHIHKYAIPKSFYYVPQFIETETGKVNRKENVKIFR